MPMKNPPHPGLLVKDQLDELEPNMTKAANALGVTRQQLHNVVAGRCGITPEMAVRLEKGIGSTAAFWLRLQMNYDLAQVQQRAASLQVKSLVPAPA